jgi:hypothetical protein
VKQLQQAPLKTTRPYYNLMWDPKIRRGPTLIHSSCLERECVSPGLRKRLVRPKNITFLEASKSRIIQHFPQVLQLLEKREFLDYSAYLEEQRDESQFALHEKTTQTDKLDKDRAPKELYRYEDKIRLPWRTGIDRGTQVQLCGGQETINRVSNTIASQTIAQSVLETTECEELASIRGQADELQHWIAVDKKRRYQKQRDLCRKIRKFQELEKELEKEEKAMKIVVGRVEASCYARSFAKTLMGVVLMSEEIDDRKEESAEDMTDWINTWSTTVVHNMGVARTLLDDMLIEVSKFREDECHNNNRNK